MEIDPKDLQIDIFRSGYMVKSTVRVTHIPTGITQSSDIHKSEHKNKMEAIERIKTEISKRTNAKV